MAQTINIAELKIDNKKLLSTLSATKKSIQELTAEQKNLKNAGEENSKEFIQNEANLKNLKKEYNSQQKVLQATTKAKTKLNSELTKEIKTLDAAKANNAELRQIRNQLNSETKEGAKAIEALNAKVDENTKYIEENVDAFENQKMQIGDYKNQIMAAANELNPLNGGLSGFIARSKEAGGAGALMKSSLGGMAQGFLGVTKASLAFIATPIGVVIAALVGAFLLVKNAMNRSEDSTNKIKKAFAAFSGITNKLLKILEPLGVFLIDGLVKGFELVEKGIYKALDAIAQGLDYLGFDEQAASLRGFNTEIKQAAKDAKILADAEAKLQKEQRKSEKIQLDYQKRAEKLRQIRDDESKSTAERVKANEDLGKLLKEQSAEEIKIANLALQVANLRIEKEGKTTEALEKRGEALKKISEIQERITSQESEQLSNLNGLRRDAAAKHKERQDKAIQKQQELLDKYIAEQGTRAKTLKEQLKVEQNKAKKSIEILNAELKAKNISQEKYDTEVINIKNNLLQKQAELSVQNAQIELDNYIQNNQSKIDNDKYFSDESLRIEQERINAISQKQRDFAAKQLEEGVINQTEYNSRINAINEENRLANEEVENTRKEAKKEKDAEDYANKLILDEEKFINQFDLDTERLEQQRIKEVEAAEKSGADVTLINKKYATQQKRIDDVKNKAQLDAAANTFGDLSAILGEHTAAGKAAGIAQATINTYQGVTEVWKAPAVLPEPFNTASKVVGTATTLAGGLSAVKKISSTKVEKKARGGILNGKPHSQGGIPMTVDGVGGYEGEGGEAIINKKSTAMYAPLLSALNEAGGGVKFAEGGILGTSTIAPASMIDYDLLALKVAQANQSLPAPVVSVSEINNVSNNVRVIESQATF